MNTIPAILSGLAVLALLAWASLKSGFARWLFFRLYAWVKGDEMVGPSVLHNAPVNSPYQRWLDRARDEMPVYEGGPLQDIEHMDLPPWPQMGIGVRGIYLHLADYQMLDSHIIELPPGGETQRQAHLYEKGVYYLSGSGHTILQPHGGQSQEVSWSAGDLFSIPLNVPHQHRNDGDQPARLLVVTCFPLMLNLLDNEAFLKSNPGVFAERYDADPGYIEQTRELARLELAKNLVKDIRTTPPRENDFRGKGNRSIRWQMAGNRVLDMHISELPPGLVKKAHRISSNAIVLVLSGTGFTVLWREGAYRQRQRIDWKPGTLFSPPVFWYQQHLNSGSTPARYLAINVPGFVRNIGLHFEDQLEVDIDEVRDEWHREMKGRSGARG